MLIRYCCCVDGPICTTVQHTTGCVPRSSWPWQQWTDTSVWFDNADIPAFHSCVVVDLCQSLSEWRLLLFVCVFVCCLENVGAAIRALSVREFLASKQITVL
jgi:hypothetical protein